MRGFESRPLRQSFFIGETARFRDHVVPQLCPAKSRALRAFLLVPYAFTRVTRQEPACAIVMVPCSRALERPFFVSSRAGAYACSAGPLEHSARHAVAPPEEMIKRNLARAIEKSHQEQAAPQDVVLEAGIRQLGVGDRCHDVEREERDGCETRAASEHQQDGEAE